MKIEIRSDAEIHVSGYVNAVERDSRVLPPEMAVGAGSRFVEKVSAGAFKRAIERNPNVRLYYNHQREIGSVSGGQLKLREDNIGLYAEAVIRDTEVVAAAKRGELRGWSFGFSDAQARWEDLGGDLKRRTLIDFNMGEVSLLNKTPAYVGTSVEMRTLDESGGVDVLERRDFPDDVQTVNSAGEIPKENTENTSKRAFFYAQKQLEMLKLKGDL